MTDFHYLEISIGFARFLALVTQSVMTAIAITKIDDLRK